MADTSKYYKAPGSDTTYTDYNAYKQNIGGATPLAESANVYSAVPPKVSPIPTRTPPIPTDPSIALKEGLLKPGAQSKSDGQFQNGYSTDYLNQLKSQQPDYQYAGVNTAQPNPATVNATPYTSQSFYLPQTPVAGFDPSTVFNDKNEGLSNEQFLAQGGKSDFSNVQKVSALQQGLAAAKASGPAPQDGGAARTEVAKFTPPAPPNMADIDMQLAQDPGYQQLMADRMEYNSVANQTKSLVDTYNEAISQAGIPALNTELLNSKNIIDGTEDDIRKEVQAVSGFATDSQVLALAGARNKSLIKNYNNLLATKQMAMENVNNLVSLSSQDRTFALNSISQKMQFDQQINEYRDKFVNNAKEAYANVVNAIGYSGLLESLQNSGDPSAVGLAERTLGFAPGQLGQIVTAQQTQSNLKNLANYNITSPYIITASGEVQNTQTGEGYSDPQDFQAKTGMTLDQAGQKGLIKDLGMTQKDQQQQFENQIDLEQLNISRGNLAVSQYNASLSAQKLRNDMAKDQAEIDEETTQKEQSRISGMAGAKGNIDLMSGLLNDKGLKSAVGPTAGARFSILDPLGTSKTNAISKIQQLTGQLTLDKLIQAKGSGATFGALSDAELKLLENSATRINSWALKDKSGNVTGYKTNEKEFKREIDKINNFAKLDYVLKEGNPLDVGIYINPATGQFETKNSDGSIQVFDELGRVTNGPAY